MESERYPATPVRRTRTRCALHKNLDAIRIINERYNLLVQLRLVTVQLETAPEAEP